MSINIEVLRLISLKCKPLLPSNRCPSPRRQVLGPRHCRRLDPVPGSGGDRSAGGGALLGAAPRGDLGDHLHQRPGKQRARGLRTCGFLVPAYSVRGLGALRSNSFLGF